MNTFWVNSGGNVIEFLLACFFGSLSFFTGYKLRKLIPREQRFTVGFFGMVIIDSLFLAYVMLNKIIWPSYIFDIGMGIGLAFSLGVGIGNPPPK
jgi:hypothetical protein